MEYIHIGRGTTNMGRFREDEVRQGLLTGRFLPGDLGWKEGMEKWTPLARMFPIALENPPADPPPIPEFPESDFFPTGPLENIATMDGGLPWERRRELGAVNAWGATLKKVLIEPSAAFTAMRRTGGIGEPILYALPGMAFGGWITFFYNTVFTSLRAGNLDLGAILPKLIAAAIGVPFFALLGIFLLSGIYHVALLLLGGAKQPFEATLRVVCFGHGSAAVLQIIPGFGSLIAFVWDVVVLSIGFARAHDISTPRAVAAVLLPVLLCALAVFALILLIGAAWLTMFNQ